MILMEFVLFSKIRHHWNFAHYVHRRQVAQRRPIQLSCTYTGPETDGLLENKFDVTHEETTYLFQLFNFTRYSFHKKITISTIVWKVILTQCSGYIHNNYKQWILLSCMNTDMHPLHLYDHNIMIYVSGTNITRYIIDFFVCSRNVHVSAAIRRPIVVLKCTWHCKYSRRTLIRFETHNTLHT